MNQKQLSSLQVICVENLQKSLLPILSLKFSEESIESLNEIIELAVINTFYSQGIALPSSLN
jgi:hypothetical protein